MLRAEKHRLRPLGVRFGNEACKGDGDADRESRMARKAAVSRLTETGNDGAELLEVGCRGGLDRFERRSRDFRKLSGLFRGRPTAVTQDGPANGIEDLYGPLYGVLRTIVCKELQPPATIADRSKILGAGHRKRMRRRRRRPKNAVYKDEAVALRSLNEKILLRGCHFIDQRPEHFPESSQLLRILLIDARYVPAELRSARPFGSTGVRSQTNIHGGKSSIDLTQGDRS
jgi:hypothetical protein